MPEIIILPWGDGKRTPKAKKVAIDWILRRHGAHAIIAPNVGNVDYEVVQQVRRRGGLVLGSRSRSYYQFPTNGSILLWCAESKTFEKYKSMLDNAKVVVVFEWHDTELALQDWYDEHEVEYLDLDD